jgi:hypothetical protein
MDGKYVKRRGQEIIGSGKILTTWQQIAVNRNTLSQRGTIIEKQHTALDGIGPH